MAGLSIEEVMGFGPKRVRQYQYEVGGVQEGNQDDVLRTEGIVSDIYGRHGIRPDVPLADAIQQIAARAEKAGAGQSMWANPEERAAARKEYALRGKTQEEVNRRWEESARLMDPDTQQYYQNYVRDMSFLSGLQGGRTVDSVGDIDATPTWRGPHEEALRYWDKSNMSPVWSDYGATNQDGAWMLYGMKDPDSLVGSYLEWSDQVPGAIRMWGSGESGEGAPTSWQTSNAVYNHNRRHRAMLPAPIGNLPSGASREDRAAAVRELQRQYASARSAMDDTARRWAQTTGWVPPEAMMDVGDNLVSTLDPTIALSLAVPAAGVARFAKPAAGIAGTGWVRPAASQLARSTAYGLGVDQASEQAVGMGILGAIDPTRPTKGSYWQGTTDVSGYLHTPEQLEQARQDRKAIVANADPSGVSRADDAAYVELMRERKVPRSFE